MACGNNITEIYLSNRDNLCTQNWANYIPFKLFNDVCLEADLNKENERALRMLWNQVIANKKKYSLSHLQFMREHIAGHLENLGIIV